MFANTLINSNSPKYLEVGRKLKFNKENFKTLSRKLASFREQEGPYCKMEMNIQKKIPDKRSTSFKDTKIPSGLYDDFEDDSLKLKSTIKVPKDILNRYNKFNIGNVREELRNNSFNYPMVASNKKQAKHARKFNDLITPHDYNSDYLMDEMSVFKVTFDNNSTTVTEMGNSGFSFTEAHNTHNPRMNRSLSLSDKKRTDTTRSVDNFLPIIHQYRREMNSPMSTNGKFSKFNDIMAL